MRKTISTGSGGQGMNARIVLVETVMLAAFVCSTVPASSETWEKVTEDQRRAWNREFDRQGLFKKAGMVSDTDEAFLRVPGVLKKDWPEGMTVATVPPTIDFAPVRDAEPRYFPEDNKSLWSNWGSVTPAPNGKFYFTEGDHRGKDSHVYMWEYDPTKAGPRRVIDFATLCGWNRIGVGDSKIHGDMGVMPDGVMWILTYWDPDPKPVPPEIEAAWPGSHLVMFDTHTRRARDLGIPIPKAGWPQYQLDPERGILFAVSFRSEVMCYDVNARKVTFFGFPPNGIVWDNRASLLDPKTGLFWCRAADQQGNILSFDPRTNTFTKYPETSPWRIRTYTPRRSSDGSFWVLTKGDGMIFKFWPDTRKVQPVTNQWKNSGYCPRIAMTADGRYFYYMAGLDLTTPGGWYREQPIVQFDTKTSKRKVIAFVTDYYFEKYGYVMMIPFGMAVSRDGSTLVINLNGAFKPRVEPLYGNPALMVVHIPKGERE